MNSMEFEDPMGGLMPQILALTAPPGTKEINNKQFQPTQTMSGQAPPNSNGQLKSGEAGLAAHPYFRRPGRGHNHDCCDACSEGGDLICCDLCPASFHLTCHDPPLEEDEIPTGEWACHQCRMGGNEDEKISNSSNKSNKSSSKFQKRKEEVKVKEELNKVFAGGREIEISDTPLYTLIRAASVINPTQFTLPYELTLPANFPGEPKETYTKKNGSKRSVVKKKPYELDNGIVPLPAKLCFQCNKSCRVGPLIPCDFCPLFYHLDCLDPPLTTPPMGRWMCPNHPEHHLDTGLLTSHSLTERVKLWNRFTAPLNQDCVKMNFFQRCHRSNPPFRYKIKKCLRTRIRVPGSIKAQYEDPPDLLPAYHDRYFPSHMVDDGVCPSLPVSNSIFLTGASISVGSKDATEAHVDRVDKELDLIQKEDEHDLSLKPTKEEKYQWLSSLLHLQSSISRHLATNYLVPVQNNIVNDLKFEITSDSFNGLDENKESFSTARPKFVNGDLVSLESKSHKLCSDRLVINSMALSSQTSSSSSSSSSRRRSHKTTRSNLLGRKHIKSSVPSEIVSDTLDSLEVLLKERLEQEEEKQEIPLSCLEESLVELLAYERLKEILSLNESEAVFSSPQLAARALLCPLVPDIKLKSVLPKTKAYCTEPVPMKYRVLNIGKGSHNHLNLELYGSCNYVSHHHASIIFDETTGHFELLNYSEYDTVVDGVTYHCDYEEKTVDQAASPPFLQHVKAIIAMRRGVESVRITSPPAAMTNRPGEKFVRCSCRREYVNWSCLKGNEESGWEGAAVLHHGSFVRFGCLKFVFSVVEEASHGDWYNDTTTTYEKFLKQAETAADRHFEKQLHQIDEEYNEIKS